MFRKILFAVAFMLVSVTQARASGQDPFAGLSGELRIAGGEVGLAAIREAASRIMKAHPDVTISFTLTGPGMGMARVRLRQADICLYDRAPRLAPVKGEPLVFVPYAVDPVAVVLNPANTAGELTTEQVSNLFRGRIRNWSEAGGQNMPVLPLYIQVSEEQGKPETRPGAVSVSSQPAMRFTLVRNRETMGLSSLRDLDASLKPVVLDGTAPSFQALKDGKYRVYRVLNAAVRQARSPLAQAFLDYMTGPEGQAVLESVGYLPLSGKPAWESSLPVDDPDLLVKQDQ